MSDLRDELGEATRKAMLAAIARRLLEPSPLMCLLGTIDRPPPTWRQRFAWRVRRFRERLGEMIAGREFGDE